MSSLIYGFPAWLVLLAVVGAFVSAALGIFAAYLVYHILRGFVLACSYMRWSFRVMKLNERKPVWRRFFSTLFSAWFRYIGYVNNGSETISQGRSVWRGFGDSDVYDDRIQTTVPPKPKTPGWVPLHEFQGGAKPEIVTYAEVPDNDNGFFDDDDIDEEDEREMHKMTAGGSRLEPAHSDKHSKHKNRK